MTQVLTKRPIGASIAEPPRGREVQVVGAGPHDN
jgi:hypothetical protein